MVYIYRKKINGNCYYYLRLSKRVKGRQVVKDIAYLGNNLAEVKKKLEKLDDYKEEIRKGYNNIKRFVNSTYYLEKVKQKKLKKSGYLEQDFLEQIEALKLHYASHFFKLDRLTVDEAYKHFLIDFAFNTTSIEGNTITLKEAQKLLEEDILPKNKTLREVYDIQNTENVFFWLLEKRPIINEKLIIEVHDKLMERIDSRKGYRTHEIRVFKSRFDASPVRYISIDMKLLFEWFNENKNKLHPFVLGSIFHHKLEKIHPFADGNGRTGRMMLNYILMREGYPPLIVAKTRRNNYLDALSAADKSGLKDFKTENYKKLITYLAKEMISSYWNNFNI